jgi:DTW domain-containing protein YfiP
MITVPTMFLLLVRTTSTSAWIRPSPLPRISTRCFSSNPPANDVLQQVQETVDNVLHQYSPQDLQHKDFVHTLNPQNREAFGVAQVLQKRLQSFHRSGVNCSRCWFQKAHCICSRCPPIALPGNIHRIFVVLNHKEICLAVDTAKLILSTFPTQSRLVVAGIGPEYQSTMKEMMEAVEQNDGANCLVLFPTDHAKTFAEIYHASPHSQHKAYDLIVLDGTWSQARKIHSRLLDPYETLTRVQLAEESLANVRSPATQGHSQLRRHPIDWRTISTMEATRLLLKDMATVSMDENSDPFWEDLLRYQQLVNEAALNQLGPPRARLKREQ